MKLPELLEFFRAETLAMHESLDLVGVPRWTSADEDEPLSLAQRVQFLVEAHAAMLLARKVINRCAG